MIMKIIIIVLSVIVVLLITFWLAQIDKDVKKLKQKVRDNKELIKDLYRIDDERLLHSKTN